MHVYGDGTGKFDWLSHFRKRDGKLTHLATLPGGMLSGKASVVIVGKLKDGSYAVLQTSLRIMLDACASWMTAFGVEADGSRMPPPTDATRERINTALMLKLIREREGGEVTVGVAEINDIMSDSTQDVSIEYAADGKSLTLRTRTND